MLLDNLALILLDLNKEIKEKTQIEGALVLQSDGENHVITLLSSVVWSSEIEKQMEDIPPLEEIKLNERENFEEHLRHLVRDQVNLINSIQL